MPPRRASALYPLLLFALVASFAALSFSLSSRLAGYLREAVAVDIRYGTLAEKGISVAVASAASDDPARLAAARYLGQAGAALIVFEGVPSSVEISGRAADLAWLDSSMAVRFLDEDRPSGAIVAAPVRTSFLLVLPDGYAAKVNLRKGERLQII